MSTVSRRPQNSCFRWFIAINTVGNNHCPTPKSVAYPGTVDSKGCEKTVKYLFMETEKNLNKNWRLEFALKEKSTVPTFLWLLTLGTTRRTRRRSECSHVAPLVIRRILRCFFFSKIICFASQDYYLIDFALSTMFAIKFQAVFLYKNEY